MARQSQTITNDEGILYSNWCIKHGFPPGDSANAEFVANYFLTTWNADITEQNLELALPQLRSHLKALPPAEAEYGRLSEQLGPDYTNVIWQFLPTYRLESDFANFNEVGRYCIQNSVPITLSNLQARIGNLMNSPRGQFLHWRPTPDQLKAQKEKQEHREQQDKEAAQAPKKEKTNPQFLLDPKLAQWKEMLDRPSETVEVPVKKDGPDYWQGRCETAVASIGSNIDRAQAQQILDRNKGGNYQFTLQEIQRFIERRTFQRSVAGRR